MKNPAHSFLARLNRLHAAYDMAETPRQQAVIELQIADLEHQLSLLDVPFEVLESETEKDWTNR